MPTFWVNIQCITKRHFSGRLLYRNFRFKSHGIFSYASGGHTHLNNVLKKGLLLRWEGGAGLMDSHHLPAEVLDGLGDLYKGVTCIPEKTSPPPTTTLLFKRHRVLPLQISQGVGSPRSSKRVASFFAISAPNSSAQRQP